MASRRRARPSRQGGTMRKHLTPGTVLGTVAVVFACTGSATAGVLITSNSIKDGTIQARDIKKGTISSDRLASSVRTQLAKAGTPGPAGPAGPAGERRRRCSARPRRPARMASTARTARPARPAKDGFNPATLVATNGAAGWNFVGGGGASPYPTASFSGGELRLQGGFDATTPSGAIGLVRAGNDAPLSSLKTLSYDFRLIKRNAGSVVAPTIHISVMKANTGTPSGFTNFVFEPYVPGRLRPLPALQPRRHVGQVVVHPQRGRHQSVQPGHAGRRSSPRTRTPPSARSASTTAAPRATRPRPTSSPPASTT